jgi:hypothetical protein
MDQVRFAILAIFGIVVTASITTVLVPDNQMLTNIIMGCVGAIAGLAGNETIKI